MQADVILKVPPPVGAPSQGGTCRGGSGGLIPHSYPPGDGDYNFVNCALRSWVQGRRVGSVRCTLWEEWELLIR